MASRERSPAAGAFVSAMRRLAREVWFRAALFTLAAVVFALAAGFIGRAIPLDVTIDLGQNSVDSILQIIATAMLTATTFSATAMVTAYSSASSSATPRATQLLVADTTSQNALATFLGSFVFALVGIIALSTGYYGDEGRTIMFLGALVVVAIIVVTLLRWIAHLARFGRMADVIDRVEDAASTAVGAYARTPTFGARPMSAPPADAQTVWADESGYVAHVDLGALDRIAERWDAEVFVTAIPGTFADALHPIASVRCAAGATGPADPAGSADADRDDDLARAVRGAFRIAEHRDFEQDPRLGVIALSEIASRALSPATNDPGTAIDVLAALQRVFTLALTTEPSTEVVHERVWMRSPRMDELVVDGFRPIARDGAGVIEVQIRLQKTLAALAALAPAHGARFAESAADARRRARGELDREDARELARVSAGVWAPARRRR